MIYVYAIAESRPALAAASELRLLTHGDIAAVYSDEPPAGLEPTEAALWRHEEILEELMAERAILPLRFGSTLTDEHELRELLSSRHREFAAALRDVRGKVELGVRAVAAVAPPAAPRDASGRAYVTAKLERRRAAARMGEDLHHELAPLARASTFRLTADPRPAFAGAYLVDRTRIDEFRRGVEAARAARPQLALACTGPWPPFSFTEPLESA